MLCRWQARTESCDPEARLELLLMSVSIICYAPMIAVVRAPGRSIVPLWHTATLLNVSCELQLQSCTRLPACWAGCSGPECCTALGKASNPRTPNLVQALHLHALHLSGRANVLGQVIATFAFSHTRHGQLCYDQQSCGCGYTKQALTACILKATKPSMPTPRTCILSVPLTLLACLQGSRQSCYQAMLR